jgi:hypothetical protein
MARTRWNWLVVLAVWAVAALVLLVRAHGLAASTPLLGDTDDAMRLVQAMDLAAGQPWQDLTQHRDNAPFGASMHWSRLVDAPLAVLMVAATPLFGAAAPDVAAMAWPLLLLLGLLVLSAALARKLVPDADMATGLMLPLLNLVLIVEFLPGRVDHHGVQILLSGAMLLLLVGWRRRWWGGALAGLLVATSLAVGLETVLVAGVACLGMGLCWLGDPERQRSGAIGFGLGLALGLAGHLWLATPSPALLQVACDMLSVVHVAAGAIGGLGLAASAAVASRRGWPVRLGLLGATGAAALAAVLLVAPRCLGGPYVDVPPDAFTLMFPGIAEAQSLAQRLEFNLASGIGMAATTLAAVPLTLWIAWRKQSDARVDWLLVAAFLTVLAVLMLLQIRAARLAALFALPAGAWLITAARQRYLGRQSLGRALGLVAAWLSFATLAQYVVASAIGAALPRPETGVARSYGVDPVSCLMPEAYAELAALPVGRVVAPIGISAHLLRYTSHAVLSAGFHRNVQSVRDEVAVFEGEETAARQVVVARKLTYAVTCPGTSQYQGWSAPRDWDWLVEISQPGARLRIDRIVP